MQSEFGMLLLLLSIHDLLQPFVPIDVLYLIEEFTQVRVGFKNGSILEPALCFAGRPGVFNQRDRAKWDAWKAVEGFRSYCESFTPCSNA